jgi:spore germination protein KC
MSLRRRIRRAASLFAAAALICAQAAVCGCTPHKELKDLAIVEAIGIDLTENGNYIMTFQILDPSGGGGGGEGSGKSSSLNSTSIVQSTGKSILSASLAATRQMGRKLFYASNRALVLGKPLCQKGIYQIMDSAERSQDASPGERIFMAEDMAQDIVTARDSKGYISGDQMAKISENGYNTSMVTDVALSDLERQMSVGITDICLPILKVKQIKSTSAYQQNSSSAGAFSSSGSSSGQSASLPSGTSGSSYSSSGSSSGTIGAVTIDGTAIFCRGKEADEINSLQTRGLLWIRERDRVKGGTIVVDTDEGSASLEIIGSSSSIKADEENGRAVMKVFVELDLKLDELRMTSYTMDESFLNRLNSLAAAQVRSEAEDVLNIGLKKDKADIFGFGEKMYRMRPELWHSMQKTWRQDIDKTKVTLEIKSTIKDVGQIIK